MIVELKSNFIYEERSIGQHNKKRRPYAVTDSTVLYDNRLSDASKVLHSIMLMYARLNKRAGQKELAERLDWSESKVKRCISQLKENGYLDVIEHKQRNKESGLLEIGLATYRVFDISDTAPCSLIQLEHDNKVQAMFDNAPFSRQDQIMAELDNFDIGSLASYDTDSTQDLEKTAHKQDIEPVSAVEVSAEDNLIMVSLTEGEQSRVRNIAQQYQVFGKNCDKLLKVAEYYKQQTNQMLSDSYLKSYADKISTGSISDKDVKAIYADIRKTMI